MSFLNRITLDHINTQRVGVPFTVHGTFHFGDAKWIAALEYSDDDNTSTAQPLGNAVVQGSELCTFSFQHAGYATAGTYTFRIVHVISNNKNSVVSNKFQVV